MPSSAVRTFTEPDEYAAAMRQGTVGFTVMERGTFTATLRRIDLHSLWLQRFSASLGWTSHIDYWGGFATIAFQSRPGPIMVRNGRECAFTGVARLSAAQSYYLRSPGANAYGTISLPLEKMAALGPTVGGREPTASNDLLILTPPPRALATLRRLHEAAGHLAGDAPSVLAHPEAAHGLEQALVAAMINCLGGGLEEDGAAKRQHSAIMRRFRRVIEDNIREPLYLPELCKEIGASERTLRVCCQEHLGVGAKHFLLLRRMSLARRALRETDPAVTTVTEIATRYGFWQLGRFSGEYRSLFGELPSTTLARPPE